MKPRPSTSGFSMTSAFAPQHWVRMASHAGPHTIFLQLLHRIQEPLIREPSGLTSMMATRQWWQMTVGANGTFLPSTSRTSTAKRRNSLMNCDESL